MAGCGFQPEEEAEEQGGLALLAHFARRGSGGILHSSRGWPRAEGRGREPNSGGDLVPGVGLAFKKRRRKANIGMEARVLATA